jgi:hypothetical protein
VRRALILLVLAIAALVAGIPAAHAAPVEITITGGQPDKNPANVPVGEDVFWRSGDGATYHIVLSNSAERSTSDNNGISDSVTITDDLTYIIDAQDNGVFSIHAVQPATTTTTTTTTTKPSTTTSSTTTTTSSTTTTTSSTTTTTTTLVSSASGSVGISDSGGGDSSSLPLILGGTLVVAALAGGAYFLWWRSGAPGADTNDPTQGPPTGQGPAV